MNKTLYNLYIKTTKEDKTKVFAIHMSGEMQANKTKAVYNTHIRIEDYNFKKSRAKYPESFSTFDMLMCI